MTLKQAHRVGSYQIKGFYPTTSQQLRLMELGFKNGERLAILQRAPWGGPIKIMIKQSRFAICQEDAACIPVEPLPV